MGVVGIIGSGLRPAPDSLYPPQANRRECDKAMWVGLLFPIFCSKVEYNRIIMYTKYITFETLCIALLHRGVDCSPPTKEVVDHPVDQMVAKNHKLACHIPLFLS